MMRRCQERREVFCETDRVDAQTGQHTTLDITSQLEPCTCVRD